MTRNDHGTATAEAVYLRDLSKASDVATRLRGYLRDIQHISCVLTVLGSAVKMLLKTHVDYVIPSNTVT